MHYGRAIRLARVARGLRQADLGQKLGCDASLVSLIEGGRRDPNADMWEAIASALDLPVALLDVLAAEHVDLEALPEAEVHALGVQLLSLLTRRDLDGASE